MELRRFVVIVVSLSLFPLESAFYLRHCHRNVSWELQIECFAFAGHEALVHILSAIEMCTKRAVNLRPGVVLCDCA